MPTNRAGYVFKYEVQLLRTVLYSTEQYSSVLWNMLIIFKN